MNLNNEPYLCTSIFYSQANWHNLTTNCLVPFLIREKRGVISYFINFSKDQGENIQLVIECTNCLSLKEKLSYVLNQYMKSNPSITGRKNSPEDVLFTNFPNNNYYFNLFKAPAFSRDNFADVLKHKLKALFTQLIIDKLAKEEIDDETLLSFGIYVHCATLKVILGESKTGLMDMKEISTYLTASLPVNEQVKVDLQCLIIKLNNASELTALYNEIWFDANNTQEFNWLKKFISKLGDLLKPEDKSKEMSIMPSKLLFEQLSLTSKRFIALAAVLTYQLKLQMSSKNRY